MLGNGQTFTNKADLVRGTKSGDSTGNQGFIQDHGNNNTIINEGSITTTAFHNAAIFVGNEASFSTARTLVDFISSGDHLPLSRIINRGVLDGNYAGIRTETWSSVEIINSGTIDKINSVLKYANLSILNKNGGDIANIDVETSLNIYKGTIDPSNPQHHVSIDITNDNNGQIEKITVVSSFSSNIGAGLLDELEISTHIINAEDGIIGSIPPEGGSNEAITLSQQRSHFFSADDDALFLNNVLLDNEGLIQGNITLWNSQDIIKNSGTIAGSVYLKDGDDRFELLPGGIVTGLVDGGDGDDKLVIGINQDETRLASSIFSTFLNFETFGIDGGGMLVFDTDINFPSVTIDSGLVRVDGTFFGNINIGAGATLGGNGRINGDTYVSGFLGAGASIGTLTITGNLILDSSSTLAVEFNDSGADLVIVEGAADLQGGTINFVPEGENVFGVFSYEVLRADGGITGIFNTTLAPNYALIDLRYEGTSLFADIITQIGSGVDLSLQSAITANYLNKRLIEGASPSTIEAFNTLASLNPLTELNTALSQLHPEAYAATSSASLIQGLSIADSFSTIAMRRSSIQNGINLWTTGLGDFSQLDGNVQQGTSNFKTNSYGLLAGVDFPVTDRIILGAFLGYSDFNQNFTSLEAKTEGNSTIFGGYLDVSSPHFQAGALVAYGDGEAKTLRNLTSLNAGTDATYNLNTLTVHGEFGYSIFKNEEFSVTPYAKLTYISSDRDKATEKGANGANLIVSAEKSEFLVSDIGVKLSGNISENVSTDLTLGWRYSLKDSPISATARFFDETDAFTVSGAKSGRSRFIGGAGLSVNISQYWILFARYNGEFGNKYSNNAGRIGMRVKF